MNDKLLIIIIYAVLAFAIEFPVMLFLMSKDGRYKLSPFDAPIFVFAPLAIFAAIFFVGWIGWAVSLTYTLLMGVIQIYGSAKSMENLYIFVRLYIWKARIGAFIGASFIIVLLAAVPNAELRRLMTLLTVP